MFILYVFDQLMYIRVLSVFMFLSLFSGKWTPTSLFLGAVMIGSEWFFITRVVAHVLLSMTEVLTAHPREHVFSLCLNCQHLLMDVNVGVASLKA